MKSLVFRFNASCVYMYQFMLTRSIWFFFLRVSLVNIEYTMSTDFMRMGVDGITVINQTH